MLLKYRKDALAMRDGENRAVLRYKMLLYIVFFFNFCPQFHYVLK
jgi:hypothetical protein